MDYIVYLKMISENDNNFKVNHKSSRKYASDEKSIFKLILRWESSFINLPNATTWHHIINKKFLNDYQANLNYLSFLYAIRICLILDTRSTLNLIFLTSSYEFAIKVQVVCNPKEDPYIVFIECPIKN